MSEKLTELAKHCEQAEGPDRSIDGLIAHAIGCTMPDDPAGWPPRYTASIDAALTLVPPWSWRVGNLPSGRAFADLGTQKSLQCIEGATPALALCAVALRARAAPNAIKQDRTMSKSNVGILKSVGAAEDDEGRPVLRAVVDFYDGAAPDIYFAAVWNRTPVTIVEVAAVEAEDRGHDTSR